MQSELQPFGEESLRTAIQNFITHYDTERNHQRLGQPTNQARTGPSWKSRGGPSAAAPGRLVKYFEPQAIATHRGIQHELDGGVFLFPDSLAGEAIVW